MNKVYIKEKKLYQRMRKKKDTLILKSIIKMNNAMERKYAEYKE